MTILNNRITQVCYRHTIITDAQFGFRKGKFTVDAIYIDIYIYLYIYIYGPRSDKTGFTM